MADFSEESFIDIDSYSKRGEGALATRMGFKWVKLSAQHSIALMPVEGNTQPLGLVHGGAYVVLGESLGSFSANLHAQSLGDEFYAVGIDINATHTRSATSGWVRGEARAIHLGGSLTVHEIVCTDEAGNRLSTVRITNMIRKMPPQKTAPTE